MKLKILVIHQNFPGQFRRITKTWLGRNDLQVIGIGARSAPGLDGLDLIRYELHRKVSAQQHPYLRQMEDAVLRGQAVARVLLSLRDKGFTPDIILAHPGWGETLYAKDVFPATKLVHFAEWFYGTSGSDTSFDPEFPSNFDTRAKVKTWNGLHLMNLENCDVAISPTEWQRSRHPEAYHHKIQVVHEGIDTEYMAPDETAEFVTPNGKALRRSHQVITYVARNLEPYRGFHQFMRALPKIQAENPDCETLIVGGNEVSYGGKPKKYDNWKDQMLSEVSVDMNRTHFLGKLPFDAYRKVLQLSTAHIYLSYPFVLSWSCLEAMSTGCVVIGSKTAPVQEVIQHGRNGYLIDFFKSDELASAVSKVLQHRSDQQQIRLQAREDMKSKYDVSKGQRRYDELLAQLGPAHSA